MRVSFSITLPMNIATAVQSYAKSNKLSISAAIAKLLSIAFEALEGKSDG